MQHNYTPDKSPPGSIQRRMLNQVFFEVFEVGGVVGGQGHNLLRGRMDKRQFNRVQCLARETPDDINAGIIIATAFHVATYCRGLDAV